MEYCEEKRRLIKEKSRLDEYKKKDDNYECSQRTGGLGEPGDPIPLRFEVIADKKVRSTYPKKGRVSTTQDGTRRRAKE